MWAFVLILAPIAFFLYTRVLDELHQRAYRKRLELVERHDHVSFPIRFGPTLFRRGEIEIDVRFVTFTWRRFLSERTTRTVPFDGLDLITHKTVRDEDNRASSAWTLYRLRDGESHAVLTVSELDFGHASIALSVLARVALVEIEDVGEDPRMF